jgi:hypothetical protein
MSLTITVQLLLALLNPLILGIKKTLAKAQKVALPTFFIPKE